MTQTAVNDEPLVNDILGSTDLILFSRYGDIAGNTVEENSSIFSLI